MAIQEPYLDHLNASRLPAGWRPVYPSTHFDNNPPRSRSLIAVNPSLSTNEWQKIECPSPDITAIRVLTSRGPIIIINVYNPCDVNSSLPHAEKLIKSAHPEDHVILLGDFNRHHPMWDEDRNAHLFSTSKLNLAQPLLDLIGEHGLNMALPKDIPTLQSTSSKNYTRPDNIFLSDALLTSLISCDSAPQSRPPCTDHIPILTEIDASPSLVKYVERANFAKADWDLFRTRLTQLLADLPGSKFVTSQAGIDERWANLREAIQQAVKESVPALRIHIMSKRWWSKELESHRTIVRSLAARSFRCRWNEQDPVHALFTTQRNMYSQALKDAKKGHWEKFLEDLDDDSMWTAANYIKGEHADGGKARIPNLKRTNPDGTVELASDNETKSEILLETFFPPPPSIIPTYSSDDAPAQVPDLPDIQTKDIEKVILAMKPHKAPGPDGLPACVYIQGVKQLLMHLLPIFRASLRLSIYPSEWKHSKTAVLRKGGKSDYSVAKAYRPIALLNVSSKILSACIANRLNTLANTHNWIPAHHFGGRPGRTTSDALHLLTKTVKDAWARGQVASALFLDVKGAFPHAHPKRLAENMRLLGVPSVYIKWMLSKLEGRTTCLSFDDFISIALPILNGIDQGCPLSVIFYLFYNSPLVRIPKPKSPEMCIAYIDDITLVTWGMSFAETHVQLADMLLRQGGALDWSESHSSTFEIDKTACIDFTRKKSLDRPTLVIRAQSIVPVPAHTLLGVVIDQELRWKEQCNKALAKGMQWSTQLNRLAKMSYGASALVARRLYLSIAVPRFTYAVDVWYTPVILSNTKGEKSTGSIGFAKRLARIQNTATRAILGAMQSTPTDSLDAHASLLPMHLLLNEACQRAAIRLAAAPLDHPLSKIIAKCSKGRKAHIAPLQHILQYTGCKPSDFEKWPLDPRSLVPVPPGYFPNRITAVMNAWTDQAHLQVYADGASSKDGVGSAAILWRDGKTITVAGKRLGDQGTHSILDAEVAAILIAAHLVLNTPHVDDATIFSDSQTAILCVQGKAKGATLALVTATKRAIKRAREKEEGTEIRLQWCPGHSDVRGNELADLEAKAAAGGKSYPSKLVPPTLSKYQPPSNATTLKKKLKVTNRDAAETHWRATKAGTKFHKRYPHLSPFNFLELSRSLPRSRATLLFRLITGHAQLQQHLHRLQVVNTSGKTSLANLPVNGKQGVFHHITRPQDKLHGNLPNLPWFTRGKSRKIG